MSAELLTPMLDALASSLLALLFALGSLAITRLLGWLKLSEDAKVRAYLDEGLHNAIAFATAKVAARMPQAVPAERRNAIIAEAAAYATARVPGALRRFDIDEDGARDMISARLPSMRNEVG